MHVEFLEPAREEFAEAVAFYNSRKQGLGLDFAIEVQRAIERVLQYPEAWSRLSRRTRRCRTNRFPYGVVYQVRGELLLIVAVMHVRRRPATWRNRLRDLKDHP
jgi:hypothetical protein